MRCSDLPRIVVFDLFSLHFVFTINIVTNNYISRTPVHTHHAGNQQNITKLAKDTAPGASV